MYEVHILFFFMKIEWIIIHTIKNSIFPTSYSHSGQQVIKHVFVYDELYSTFFSKIEYFDSIICDLEITFIENTSAQSLLKIFLSH